MIVSIQVYLARCVGYSKYCTAAVKWMLLIIGKGDVREGVLYIAKKLPTPGRENIAIYICTYYHQFLFEHRTSAAIITNDLEVDVVVPTMLS